jgi:hypothetical protein
MSYVLIHTPDRNDPGRFEVIGTYDDEKQAQAVAIRIDRGREETQLTIVLPLRTPSGPFEARPGETIHDPEGFI